METKAAKKSSDLYPLVGFKLNGRPQVIIPTVLGPEGMLPRMGKPGDGAHDLYANPSSIEEGPDGEDVETFVEKITIEHCSFAVIPVLIQTEIPEGYRGWITGRSGYSRKGILAAVGLIDSGYRGYYGVVLYNFSGRPFTVTKGDRVAQLSIEAYPDVHYVEVDSLAPSERGANGWGHTGVR